MKKVNEFVKEQEIEGILDAVSDGKMNWRKKYEGF
jgi:hypothetical protein